VIRDRDSLVDTDELRAFDIVATKKSFSLAAVEIGCSQSTVSQRIARLEKRINRRLIERTTRQVQLTHDGEEARIRLSRPELRGFLKVGIEDEFATTQLPQVLGIFRAQFPDFGLKFITGRNEHLRDVLRSREVDIILGKSHADSASTALWQEQLIWIGHPALQLGAADPVPLISYINPSITRSIAEAALLAGRRQWIEVAECSNLLGKLAAARSGLGVMAIGRSFRKPYLGEVPAEAGLPPLGKLSYVIESNSAHPDSATGAFHAILSELAVRTAGQPAPD